MNINDIVVEVLKETDFDKILKENLKNNIEKTLKETIEDIYGSSYSHFGRILKNKFEKELSINLDAVNIPQYNMLVQKAIENEIGNNIEKLSRNSAKQLIDRFTIGDMKEVYNFSELLEKFKDSCENYEDEEKISLHIENSDYSKLKFIYLDEESNKPNYSCKYRIVLDEEKISSLNIKGTEITDVLLTRGNFDNLLANIFLQGKKINLDCGTDADDYDLYYETEGEE